MRFLFWKRQRPVSDFADEITAHLEMEADRLVREGMPRHEAVQAARRNFGNVTTSLERFPGAQRGMWLDHLVHDTRYAIRGIVKHPAFSFGVIATLTLGLGINSAIFRLFERYFVRLPAAVTDAATIRQVVAVQSDRAGSPAEVRTFSYHDVRLLAGVPAFARYAVHAPNRPGRGRLADGRDIPMSTIGEGFADVLGLVPAAGRLFSPDELRPGAEIASAVISHAMWRAEFGGDASVVGRTLEISGRSYTIIGVAPRGFTGIDLDPVDVWLPLGTCTCGSASVNGVAIPWYEYWGLRLMQILVRVHDGADDATAARQAETALNTAAASGNGPPQRTLALRSLIETRTGGPNRASAQILARVAGVALLILLLACANVSNLLLARAIRRRPEIAIRLALGISPGRLVRQLATESVLLSLIGACVATLLGFWAAAALRTGLFPTALWSIEAFDGRTVAFTFSLSLLVGTLIGVVPALQARRARLTPSLGAGRITRAQSRPVVRGVFVVAQAALSVVLLIGTTLFIASLLEIARVDLGMTPRGLVTVVATQAPRARPSGPGPYTDVGSIEDWAEAIRRRPDVQAVALASIQPFGAQALTSLAIPGRETLPESESGGPLINGVTPDYFAAMGMRVLRGRALTPNDGAGAARVMVVNQTLATLYWPNGDAIGGCIEIGSAPCSEVVGVVQDLRDQPMAPLAVPRYYVPLEQMSPRSPPRAAIVRLTGDRTAALVPELQRILIGGYRPGVMMVESSVAESVRSLRVGAAVFSGLGGLALLLACVGLSSVLLYVISERMHEIGIRMALGASGRSVTILVLRAGMSLALIGVALGVVGGVAGARALSSVVFGVSVTDPLIYVTSGAVLLAAALVACAAPAVRARRVDPAVVLRDA